jgi:hypothetical protein
VQHGWYPGLAGDGKGLGIKSNPQRQREQLVFRAAEIRALQPKNVLRFLIGPVSNPNSLITGNLTGNFSNLGRFLCS